MKKMPWFRVYAEIVDDEILQFLSFEDQRHFVWILALKCAGLLDKEYPIEGMLDSVVSRKLGLRGEAFDNAKIRLVEVGLIDSNWQPKNWDARQYVSDSSTERVRKFREKRSSNVSVTPPDTDTDTDTENNPRKGYSSSAADACPHQDIIALYHELLPCLPPVKQWTAARQAKLRQRWREDPKRQDLDWWRRFFAVVAASDFLCGRATPPKDRRPFLADLEWLVSPRNFVKVLEGRYD